MDLTYRSPKTEIRESPIHGKGLFAREPVSAGEIIAVKGGHIVDRETWQEIETELGSAEIQVTEDLFIAPVRQDHRDGSMLFINHSCDPNIGPQGQIVFAAMRDIEAGEELTHDWATTDDLDYEIACNCGAVRCRGRVTGKDWMKPELREKYAGWFCWFLQRKIDEEQN